MEINRHNLPEDTAALQQMVAGLLEELEVREWRLRQLQYLVEQLLRYRYGPKRERVSENQLFLFAVTLLSAGEENAPAPEKPQTSQPQRIRHGRQHLPKKLDQRRGGCGLGGRERRGPEPRAGSKGTGGRGRSRLA